jgi:hypothetical protein
LIGEDVIEAGCMAHARCKFFDLHAQHQSPVAAEVLEFFQKLYRIEREAADLNPEARSRLERREPSLSLRRCTPG